MSKKVLFILKRRDDYSPVSHSPIGLSTGLYNSANFMHEMLLSAGIESALEIAIDNNCIDRLVTKHRPTHVIIEALWVVPSKFAILSKLHPKVKWIIRLHSEMPFMAGEGMAMDWLGGYVTYPNIDIGVNAPRMLGEIREYLKTSRQWTNDKTNRRVFYMPNYYPNDYKIKFYNRSKYWVDVACFGAVRPLKNHLLQAVASIKFANKIKKHLRFHINGGRIEMKGDPVMNNLKGLFQHLDEQGHQMVIHEWVPREDFLKICADMDMGLQCNFSETFNIVSADLISQGVPIIGSKEIPWSSCMFNADPTDSNNIADIMLRTYHYPNINVWKNQRNLDKYTKESKKIWINYFKGESNGSPQS
jgi:hypothetical protein